MTLPDRSEQAWVIHLELPPRAHTCASLYDVVYGVRLGHGAKPWPHFRGDDDRWWSLGEPYELPVRELVWLVDLDQLAHHPEDTHLPFLVDVLRELEARARTIGATVRPEGTAEEAARRIASVRATADHQQARLVATVRSADGADVPTWAAALTAAGFVRGDGDLFWADEVCAEPPGAYFHPRDTTSRFDRVDVHVALAWASPDEIASIPRLAARVAERLGAVVTHEDGAPWSDARAAREIAAWRAKGSS